MDLGAVDRLDIRCNLCHKAQPSVDFDATLFQLFSSPSSFDQEAFYAGPDFVSRDDPVISRNKEKTGKLASVLPDRQGVLPDRRHFVELVSLEPYYLRAYYYNT